MYLDSPYRTGQRFAAYDDRAVADGWLAMMREVLVGVREVLRADGSVWVHLDDREAHRTRALLDEVFGAENFVADVTWERKRKPSFLPGQVAHVTDHILVAAKDLSRLDRFTTGEHVPVRRVPLHHPGNGTSVLTFPVGTVELPGPDRTIPAGDMSTPSVSTRLVQDVRVAGGRNADPLVMEGAWRWTQERLAAGVQVRAPRLPLRPQAITGSGTRTWTTLFTRATGMATNEGTPPSTPRRCSVPCRSTPRSRRSCSNGSSRRPARPATWWWTCSPGRARRRPSARSSAGDGSPRR